MCMHQHVLFKKNLYKPNKHVFAIISLAPPKNVYEVETYWLSS